MKILILTQYFHPEVFRISDLAAGLASRGHDVTVLTGLPNYPSGKFFSGYGLFGPLRENLGGVRVLRVPLLPRGERSAVLLLLNYFSFAIFATILGPLRCREKFDAVFVAQYSPVTVGIPAVVLRWWTKAPLFFWVQDLWPDSLSATGAVTTRLVLRLVERLVRWIYRRCDVLLVQSRAFTGSLIERGAEPSRIHYFPNYAEALYMPHQTAPEDRQILGMPEGFVLMFAGNIGAAQDFSTILEAVELLRDVTNFHLVVLGDGRIAGWVREEIILRKLTERVHILGSHPMAEMPRYFAAADVMLVTLKREPIFALTIPGKVQSYLACARPIIAGLDGEGARVVEEAKAGFVAPAEDPTALADAVRRMIALSQQERAALGQNARAYYEKHFDRERLLGELEELMKKL